MVHNRVCVPLHCFHVVRVGLSILHYSIQAFNYLKYQVMVSLLSLKQRETMYLM